MTVLFAPFGGFLVFLAQGWRLPFIVEPMPGHHGLRGVVLEK